MRRHSGYIFQAMQLAMQMADKSECDRAKVGCVFLSWAGETLVSAFNRPHKGNKQGETCKSHGHLLVDGHCCRTIHAEQIAIIEAGKYCVDIENTILVVTHTPCLVCTPLLIEAGVKEIYIKDRYRENHASYQWLVENCIKVYDWHFRRIAW